MPSIKRRSATARKPLSKAASAKPPTSSSTTSRKPAAPTPAAAKPTTFRLDPTLQTGLMVLAQVLKKPLNRLVNEAVQGFIEKRSHEVEADLERTLERVRAARKKDPDFESAIARFAEAEASFGRKDPVEGKAVERKPTKGRKAATADPAQLMVHELLRG
jgi:predicted transcriptional regulator